jgi:hypothetical protein
MQKNDAREKRNEKQTRWKESGGRQHWWKLPWRGLARSRRRFLRCCKRHEDIFCPILPVASTFSLLAATKHTTYRWVVVEGAESLEGWRGIAHPCNR